MARRGESIYKRKDGRWEARFPCGTDETGKTVYRSVYAKTYSEVKNARRLAMQRSGKPKRSRICLASVLEQWLENRRIDLKEQSFHRYEQCIRNHIIPALGQIPIYRISEEIIDSFLQKKRQSGRIDGKGGLSQNYIRTIAIILQSALSYAFQMDLGIPRPITINKPRAERKRIHVLKAQEQIRLEAYLKQDLTDGNLAIYLGLHTGLRIGEICALRWENVDLLDRKIEICATVIRDKNGTCKIDAPKSSTSERTVPITQTLARQLAEWKKQARSDYVFPAPEKGTFLNPRTLQYRFKAILKKCSLPDVPFHTLRHTFATRWIECGMDMKSLSEILGHSNVSITMDIYVHSSEELKRTGIERMEYISGQNSGQKKAEGTV